MLVHVVLACAPGRASSVDGESGDDTSTGGPGEFDLAGSDTVGDDVPPSTGCLVSGTGFIPDVCEPVDPCADSGCASCIGGSCVLPAPGACAPMLLEPRELGFELVAGAAPLLIDLDGVLGDELVVAEQTQIVAVIGGVLETSSLAIDHDIVALAPINLDGDGFTDLIVTTNAPGFEVLLARGDGGGGFTPALAQLATPGLRGPRAIDFDGDGDDDLLGMRSYTDAELHINAGGRWIPSTLYAGFRGPRGADLDGDGIVDDAVFASHPVPDLLVGGPDGLSFADPLPGFAEQPGLALATVGSIVADLDGDGHVDVLSVLGDPWARVGARIWWGTGPGTFAPPGEDQLLLEVGGLWEVALFDLDGDARPELLLALGDRVEFVKLDARTRRFGCVGELVGGDGTSTPSFGDLDGDGGPELGVVSSDDLVEVYGLP